jgi:hypothetical protein
MAIELQRGVPIIHLSTRLRRLAGEGQTPSRRLVITSAVKVEVVCAVRLHDSTMQDLH